MYLYYNVWNYGNIYAYRSSIMDTVEHEKNYGIVSLKTHA